jgi:hypothetical protein
MKTQRGLIVVMTALVLSLLSLCIMSPAASSRGGSALGATPRPKALASALEPAQDQTVTLVVRVKDEDGKLVPGAHVNVYQETRRFSALIARPPADQQDTNANGIATFPIVVKTGEALKLSIEVSREDMQTERDDVDYGTEFPARILRQFVLKPRAAAKEDLMTVKVHVVRKDAEKDTPVEAALVEVFLNPVIGGTQRRRYSTQTDRDGDATLVTPLWDDLEIRASKQKFGQQSMSIKANAARIKEQIEEGPYTLKLERQPGFEVTITVRDQDNPGLPVTDANVVLDNGSSGYYPATTDNLGNATLFVRETGGFAVRISQDNYEPLKDGEVRLLEGEEKKTASFTLKVKPKKAAEGANSIEVTVLQGDKIDRIGRFNLPLPGASVTVGQTTLGTDPSGQVKISGDFEGNVKVTVEASGYKSQDQTVNTVRISDSGRLTGGRALVTFLMQPEATEDFIEVSVFEAGTNKPLSGATVVAGEATATTVKGRAKLTGKFENAVEVSVEKSGYLRRAKSVNASGGKGSATFTLQPVPTEDSVSVTVMGQDPKGGSPSPIKGALVSANGLTTPTDKNGQATLTGEFKETVEVGAQASGFVALTQQVSITKPARTGAANFLLQPEPPPLRLIVEVRDSATPNNRIEGASVYFLLNGKPVGGPGGKGVRETDKQGEAEFELKGDPNMPLSKLRAGLKVYVEKRGEYITKLEDITADLLLPSAEPSRYSVQLDRDWSALTAAIAALEPRVAAWKSDSGLGSPTSSMQEGWIAKALVAQKRAEELSKEIEAAKGPLGLVWPSPGGTSRCIKAAQLKADIQACETEANTMAKALTTLLDDASVLATHCSEPTDGQGIRTNYRTAIQFLAQIGALNKKAVKDRDDLLPLAQSSAAKDLLATLQSKVAEIGNQKKAAEEAAKAAADEFRRLADIKKSLVSRQIALSSELAVLEVKYDVDALGTAIPRDLKTRLDAMRQLLGSHRSDMDYGVAPNTTVPESLRSYATTIDGIEKNAKQLLATYQALAICEVDTMDQTVEGINTTLKNASFEIGLAADLPNKATACINKGKCQSTISEIRALLEQGAIDPATAKISEARTQGCDVSGIDLDYYETLRNAVGYLKAAQNNCKFQEALDWAKQMPEGVLQKPTISNALINLRAGLAAQLRIAQLRSSAKAEVTRTNNEAAAEPFIKEAERIAAPYACLVKEASNFRSEHKVTGMINNAPEFGAIGAVVAPGSKPEVEEIPETAVNKPGNKNKPEVEDIPEVAVKPNTNVASTDEPGTQPPVDFTGVWERTVGTTTLVQVGDKVTGSFDYKDGKIWDGVVKGRVLTLKWSQYNIPLGTGVLTMSADGKSFSGTASWPGGTNPWVGRKRGS